MAATINVNYRTVVHKSSNGVSTAFPDVCKTPTPGGPVPIPYPNIAMSKDTSQGSTSVKMDGNPIMLKGSVFSMSTGDEAGTAGGGVISGKIKGKAEFVNYSFDVMVEGKNVPRLADMMMQNKGSPANTPPIPEVQPPMPPPIAPENPPAEEIACSPCDVSTLTLTNSTDKQTVTCDSKARTACLSSDFMTLLGQHDVLLECMADFENDYGINPSKKAKIKVEALRTPSGTCSVNPDHPGLLFTALRNGDPADNLPDCLTKETHELELLAPSTRRSSGRERGWLAAFWNFNESEKIISVTGSSCAISDVGTANGTLKGLIKIYPQQTWKLTLKIPSFASISNTRAGSVDLRGNVASSSTDTRSTGWGASGSSSSSSTLSNSRTGTNTQTESMSETVDGVRQSLSTTEGMKNNEAYASETERTDSRTAYFLGGPRESLQVSDSTDEGSETSTTRAFQVNPQFTLTINGNSLAITDRINNIIGIARLIRDTWNELQNWAPKVGWSASLNIAIFEGDVSGEWGYRASEDNSSSRVARIEPYYTLSVDLMLFKCAVAVSFGVNFKVSNWFTGRNLVEVVVELRGSITVELPFKAEFTSGNHSQTPAALSAKSKAEIAAVARAVLLNIVCEASVSIDGGFAVDAEFKCGFQQDPVVEAKIYSLPVVVHVTLIRPDKDPYRKDIECLPKKDVWSGQFPKPSTP